MRTRDIFVSVVMRVRDAAGAIGPALERVAGVMEAHFAYYEIIIVDDCSADASVAEIAAVQARARNIQLYALARRRGDNIALTAGLDHAIGDMIVTLDPLLDPPALIPHLVERALDGVDIVYALPRARLESRGVGNRAVRGFVAALSRLINVDAPQAMSSYRLLNRTVLNYMLEAVDRHRSLMFLPALSGYPYATLEYDRLAGAAGGASTGERLAKAVDLLFSTSARPLRIITLMSLGISVLSLCYALYSVLIYVVRDDVARGWTSLSLQISGLFFLVCIILAVMSEYLLQVLEATTHHPRYHIASQRHSTTMDIARPRNVIATSGAADAFPARSPHDAAAGQPVLQQAIGDGGEVKRAGLDQAKL
ncbi:MAG: glycosyltransferase [Acetobacteraceae bacterium]|nr:glycosyltransferase [Acetobacteraceae bacterium]